MLAQTVAYVTSILVAAGLLFQLVILARVGAKIARAKRRRQQPRPMASAAKVVRPRATRRRSREYRTALRAAVAHVS